MKLRTVAFLLVCVMALAPAVPLAAAGAAPAAAAVEVLPYRIYIYDTLQALYYYVAPYWTEPYASAINRVLQNPVAVPSPGGEAEGGVVTISDDGLFTKNTFLLRGGTLEIDGVCYLMAQEDYSAVKAACAKISDRTQGVLYSSAIPFWLLWQNPNRVTAARYINHVEPRGTQYDVNARYLLNAAYEMRTLAAKRGGVYKADAVDLERYSRVIYTFDDGSTYTLAFRDERLYIEASGMANGCWYDMERAGALERFVRAIDRLCVPDAIVIPALPPVNAGSLPG